MRFSVRVCTLVTAVAAGAMVAAPLAVPASAAVAAPSCAALATKTANGKITATVSKCTPAAALGTGTGTFVAATGAKSGSFNITLTWAAKHGTTKGNVKFSTAKTLGKCKGSSRLAITGTVTGGTGTAFKTVKTGQKITASVCVGTTSDTLEPGTTLKI
jgi:hypothetical protein